MTDSQPNLPHVLPLRLYLAIGAALLTLTAITVAVSLFDFGPLNLVVALSIAAIKATLVALYFMHLRYDSRLYLVVFLTAIAFLAVFIILTLFDTLERDRIYSIKSEPIRPEAVIYKPAAADSLAGDSVSGFGFDSASPPSKQ
jgi:cytochrome c oxidase subunit 4